MQVMKIDPLDSHDRLIELRNKYVITICQGAEDCLKKNPDSLFLQSKSPYVYIFGHPRTEQEGAVKKLYWQPRLTKPQAQTNSYLFRAKSNSDLMDICWILPPEELWGQYKLGNVTESEDILWSIDQYKNNRRRLESKEDGDLSDEKVKFIWTELAASKVLKKKLVIDNKLG